MALPIFKIYLVGLFMPELIDVPAPGVGTAIRGGVILYKYRSDIQAYWKKLQVMLGLGRVNVVVTGRAGSGKSSLTSLWHGEANDLAWVSPVAASTDVEIKPISIGDWTKIVHVIPGQNSRERILGMEVAFASKSCAEGVVHVVDWGYTTIRTSASVSALMAEGVDTIDKLRSVNLQKELNEFSEVCERIRNAAISGGLPKWLVIVINKADLFFNDLAKAESYYSPHGNSAFSKILSEKLTGVIGAANIKIEVVAVSSLTKKYSWNGVEISPQIVDVDLHRSYLRSFFDTVAHVAR
ncbi:GTPase domain-containing protein [Chitinibacter sp. FCG-7]|uniref:GTPase domain-containing protein n=1 Tax=Chitinibacter mangrovi TaxID=3153927 RepID=A0AAU7FCY9_9NEIS